MKWGSKTDKYSQRSACGRYAICAIGFDNGHTGFFEAWQTGKHPQGLLLIATNLDSAATARQICEEHHAAA